MKQILKNMYMYIGVITILFIGGTYAFWGWQANINQETNVSIMVNDIVKIIYTNGSDITNANLRPTLTKDNGIVKEIRVKFDKVSEIPVSINFYLDIIHLDDGLKDISFKWEITKNNITVGNGDFSNSNAGDSITLVSGQSVNTVVDSYILYIWIDGNMENPNNMQEKLFSFKLWADGQNAKYAERKDANKPSLVDGMIPIKYNGTNWVKADVANESNEWYDYDEKIWANVVMVRNIGIKTREEYINAPVNTVIEEDDILVYLVWIPRYKYQLFNAEFYEVTPSEIQIVFEEGIAKTGNVSCSTSNLGIETCTNKVNGAWYTHPAFTFGDEELTGIWVGKFQTSLDPTSPCYTTSNPENCNNPNQSPRIKPNVKSLRSQQISTCFVTANKINSTDFVTSSGAIAIDARIIKNIEWGAVAYLTQSKYGRCINGICTEISVNNSSAFLTGTVILGVAQGGTFTYETLVGQLASTTGNIYGVYDMSGGAYEYVMGVMSDTLGTPVYAATGFTVDTMPESKYYDKYEYGTTYNDQTAYNRSHLGDALGETRGWNDDTATFMHSENSWLYRGNFYNQDNVAGIFSYRYNRGIAYHNFTFRVAAHVK